MQHAGAYVTAGSASDSHQQGVAQGNRLRLALSHAAMLGGAIAAKLLLPCILGACMRQAM